MQSPLTPRRQGFGFPASARSNKASIFTICPRVQQRGILCRRFQVAVALSPHRLGAYKNATPHGRGRHEKRSCPNRDYVFDHFWGSVHNTKQGNGRIRPLRIGMCPLVRNSECMEKFHILQRDVPSQTLPIMHSLLGAMQISGSGCFIATCKSCGTEFGRSGDVKERAAKIKTTLGDAMNGTGFQTPLV